jgi:transglutaminase-like putative cysteine protease
MPAAMSNARSWQLPAAAVFATMSSSIGLSRLIHPGAWAAIVLLVAVLLAFSGIGLRRLNVPRALIVLIQFVLVLCTLTVILVPHVAIAGVIPGPGALRGLAHQFSQGGADLRQLSPPTPETPGIRALMAISGAGFAFVIELLAVTLRRPVLAGAPILAVYLIPATREPGGLSWLAFACAAAGYLAVVGTDGHERLGQWGRTVQQRNGRANVLVGATNTGLTRRISLWAIATALVLPLLIPATPQLIDLGGNRGGGGDGPGTIYLNQSVDIAQDLSSPQPLPLFDYRTSSAAPLREYFQQEVLTQFNGTEWDPPGSAVETSSGAVAVPGLTDADVARQTVHISVDVDGNFGFSAAPSPYATTNVAGMRNTAIDANTLTVFVNDANSKSRAGTQYTTTSTDVTPTAAQLQSATAGRDALGKNYLALPNDVRKLLTDDATKITAGDSTPYQKALALQNYFQTFTYTLDPKINGTGTAAIESFLQNKAGFCQQFAATMAAMARALGIPAVVAVGYTPGTEQSDGSFQVTTHDAHAWPLLYFDGIGWVQFEPTPKIVSGGRAQAQPWTVPQSQPSASSSEGANTGPTAVPSASASNGNCASNQEGIHHIGVDGIEPNPCDSGNAGAGAGPGTKFGSLGPLGVVPRTFDRMFLTGSPAEIAAKLLLLVLALLALLPGAARLRRWRRRRRLLRKAAAGPKRQRASLPSQRSTVDDPDRAAVASHFGESGEARRALAFTAWEELREYATDLGYGWPVSDTPRQLAVRLAAQAEFDVESTEAVGRVTTLVERAVYSPDPHIAADEARSLPGDVSRVRGALGGAAGRAARLRAAVLPTSSIDQLLRRGKRER